MKTTLKQNVTGINMLPGLRKSEAEDLVCTQLRYVAILTLASTLSFGYFAMYLLLYCIYRRPLTLYL